MAKKRSIDSLSELARANPPARVKSQGWTDRLSGEDRAAFTKLKRDLDADRLAGHTRNSLWRFLREKKQITCGKQAFGVGLDKLVSAD